MRRRVPLLIAFLLLVVIGAGAAFAYFTAAGSGSGSSSGGTLQAVTVDAFVGGDTPSPSVLTPGGTADVILRVKNTNAYAVKLVTVTGGPAAITVSSGHAGCLPSDVTFTNQTNRSDAINASGTTLVHLAGAAGMSSSAASACQGATFTIPVTITVQTP
jgi:hypothetical protein